MMKTFDEIYNELENNNNEELNSAWIEAKEQNKKSLMTHVFLYVISDFSISDTKLHYATLPDFPLHSDKSKML